MWTAHCWVFVSKQRQTKQVTTEQYKGENAEPLVCLWKGQWLTEPQTASNVVLVRACLFLIGAPVISASVYHISLKLKWQGTVLPWMSELMLAHDSHSLLKIPWCEILLNNRRWSLSRDELFTSFILFICSLLLLFCSDHDPKSETIASPATPGGWQLI